jgi:hypothetical protein
MEEAETQEYLDTVEKVEIEVDALARHLADQLDI